MNTAANNGLLSMPPNSQLAKPTHGGTAASQTLNKIKTNENTTVFIDFNCNLSIHLTFPSILQAPGGAGTHPLRPGPANSCQFHRMKFLSNLSTTSFEKLPKAWLSADNMRTR